MSRSARCRAWSTRTSASTTRDVELRADVAEALGERVLGGQRGRPRPAGGHRVPGVGDGDDPRAERDRLAAQAVRIAGAVGPLVVRADPCHLVGREHLGRDLRAERGVQLHEVVLRRRQPRRLQQDRVGHAHLADVVHERRELEALQLGVRPAQLGAASATAMSATASACPTVARILGVDRARPARGSRPATRSWSGLSTPAVAASWAE